jgi:hypothetical protein
LFTTYITRILSSHQTSFPYLITPVKKDIEQTLSNTDLNSLTATAPGPITLNENDAITLTNVTTETGTIAITAGGTITATKVKIRTDSDDAAIRLIATTGGIAVGEVNAGVLFGDVVLTANGDITSQATSLVQGDNATLTAGGSILLTNTLLNSLASTSVGNISIKELDAITLLDVTSQTGNISITAWDEIAVADRVRVEANSRTISLLAKDGDISISGQIVGPNSTLVDLNAAYRIYDSGYSTALPVHITGGVLHANAAGDISLWIDCLRLENSTARSFDIHAAAQNLFRALEVTATRGDACFTMFDKAAKAAGTKPGSLGQFVLETLRVTGGSLVTSAGNTRLHGIIVNGGDISLDAMQDADGYIIFGEVRTNQNINARANLQIYSDEGSSRIHAKDLVLDVLNLHDNTLGKPRALDIRADVDTLSIVGGKGEYRVKELDALTAKFIALATGALWLQAGGDITVHDIDASERLLLQTTNAGSIKRSDVTSLIATSTLLLDVAGDADIFAKTSFLSAKVGGDFKLYNRRALEIRGFTAAGSVNVEAAGILRAGATGYTYAPWSFANNTGGVHSLTGDVALRSNGDMYLDRVSAAEGGLTLRSGGEIAWEYGTRVHLTAQTVDILAQDRIQIDAVDGLNDFTAESVMGTIHIASITAKDEAVSITSLKAFGDIRIGYLDGTANLGTAAVSHTGRFELAATDSIHADDIHADLVRLSANTGNVTIGTLQAASLDACAENGSILVNAANANASTLSLLRILAKDAIAVNSAGALTVKLGEADTGRVIASNGSVSLVAATGDITKTGDAWIAANEIALDATSGCIAVNLGDTANRGTTLALNVAQDALIRATGALTLESVTLGDGEKLDIETGVGALADAHITVLDGVLAGVNGDISLISRTGNISVWHIGEIVSQGNVSLEATFGVVDVSDILATGNFTVKAGARITAENINVSEASSELRLTSDNGDIFFAHRDADGQPIDIATPGSVWLSAKKGIVDIGTASLHVGHELGVLTAGDITAVNMQAADVDGVIRLESLHGHIEILTGGINAGVNGSVSLAAGTDIFGTDATAVAIQAAMVELDACGGGIALGLDATNLRAHSASSTEIYVANTGSTSLESVTSDAGDIAINAVGSLVLGKIQTLAGNASLTSQTGNIRDDGDAATRVRGNALTLAALGDIEAQTQVATLIANTAGSEILIDEQDDLVAQNVTTTAIDGRLGLVAGGTIQIQQIHASAFVQVKAADGDLAMSDSTSSITTDKLFVEVAGAVDANTSASIVAGRAGQGVSLLKNTGGTLTLMGIEAQGDVSVRNANGDILVSTTPAEDSDVGFAFVVPAAGIRSHGGDIALAANGTLQLGTIDAGTGSIELSANGDVTWDKSGTSAQLTAATVSVLAANNVRLNAINGVNALNIAPVSGEIQILKMISGISGSIAVSALDAASDVRFDSVVGSLLLGSILSHNGGEISFHVSDVLTAMGEVRTMGGLSAVAENGNIHFASVDAALAGDVFFDSLQTSFLDAAAGGSITVANANADGRHLVLASLYASGDVTISTGGALTIGHVAENESGAVGRGSVVSTHGTVSLTALGGGITTHIAKAGVLPDGVATDFAFIAAKRVELDAVNAGKIDVRIAATFADGIPLETVLALQAANGATIRAGGSLRLEGVSLGDNETLDVETGIEIAGNAAGNDANLTVGADVLVAGNVGDIRLASGTGNISLEGENGIRARGDVLIFAENGSLQANAVATDGEIRVVTRGDILATNFCSTGAGASIALESTGGGIEILANGITTDVDAYIVLRAKDDIVSRGLSGVAFTGGTVDMLSKDGSIVAKADAKTFIAEAARDVLIRSESGEAVSIQAITTKDGNVSILANGTLLVGEIKAGENGDKDVLLDNVQGDIHADGGDAMRIRANRLVLRTAGNVSLRTQVASIGGSDGDGELRHSGDVTILNDGTLAVDEIDAGKGTAWGSGKISLKADSLDIAGELVRGANDVSLIATVGNVNLQRVEAGGNVAIQTRDNLLAEHITTSAEDANISLRSVAGAILVASDGIRAACGASAHLEAHGDIVGDGTPSVSGLRALQMISHTGKIRLAFATEMVGASAAGDISLSALGDVALLDVESLTGGDVSILSNGSITKGSADSLVSGNAVTLESRNGLVKARTNSKKLAARASGDIDLTEVSNANLMGLVSKNGDIRLETAGAINGAAGDGEPVVVTNSADSLVTLKAGNGIGNTSPLALQVRNLAAQNGDGALNVNNLGVLNVSLAQTRNGSVTIAATDDLNAEKILAGGDGNGADLQSRDGDVKAGKITAETLSLASKHAEGRVEVGEVYLQKQLSIAAAHARVGKVFADSVGTVEVSLDGATGDPMETADIRFRTAAKTDFTTYRVKHGRMETDGTVISFNDAWTQRSDIRTPAMHVIADSLQKTVQGGNAQIYARNGAFDLLVVDNDVYSSGYFMHYRDQNSVNSAYGDEDSIMRIGRKESAVMYRLLRKTADYESELRWPIDLHRDFSRHIWFEEKPVETPTETTDPELSLFSLPTFSSL